MTTKTKLITAITAITVFAIGTPFLLNLPSSTTQDTTEQQIVALNQQITIAESQLVRVMNTYNEIKAQADQAYTEVKVSQDNLTKLYADKKELLSLFTYGQQ